MNIPRWKKVTRKRRTDLKYTDPDFTVYYDLDMEDFLNMVIKLKNGEELGYEENERYGRYIITMCIIVMEGPKFKKKTVTEREEMIEQQYMELLTGITTFDPNRGSKLYSYAYRIAYVAAIHYFTNKADEYNKEQAIIEHCKEALRDYLEEYSDHKTRRH